jgi:hypothetical protein
VATDRLRRDVLDAYQPLRSFWRFLNGSSTTRMQLMAATVNTAQLWTAV